MKQKVQFKVDFIHRRSGLTRKHSILQNLGIARLLMALVGLEPLLLLDVLVAAPPEPDERSVGTCSCTSPLQCASS